MDDQKSPRPYATRRIVNEIDIHHTGNTGGIVSIASNHATRLHENRSCYGYTIAYHYVIGRDGKLNYTRCENEIGYHNSQNNATSIGIALVGDGNAYAFTDAQYNVLRWLIDDIKSRHDINIVKGHWGWGASCPGKFFDPARILPARTNTSFVGQWSITAYYTPIRGQKTYLWSHDYETAFKLNCQFKAGRPYNGCLDTSSGYRLKPEDAFHKAACPPTFKFGTKLFIDGLGEVTCVDRGGAIKGKRLDIWVGIGDVGIRNLGIKNRGIKKVYIVN